MKDRYKKYIKLNIMSIVFIIVSLISVTLAWFAYSGLTDVSTEIGVKAWYIELEKDGEKVSNDIVISLSQIYPGMDTVNETINIKNLGDSDAQLKYSIVSARLLDNSEDSYTVDDTTTSEYVEDVLSHNYPFHINMNMTKNYAIAKTGESSFTVSVSWPLDSDDDTLDTLWGTEAYNFEKNEEELKNQDSNYQIKPSIKIVIKVTAEQYVESEESSDMNYNLGDSILYDVVNNVTCTEISSTCLKTYVIDTNNKLGDSTITLLPDPTVTYISSTYSDYSTNMSSIISGWTVTTRPLQVEDIMKIISLDITNTNLVRSGVSDSVLGYIQYGNRINAELNKIILADGYYKVLSSKFSMLTSNNCYWTNSTYNVDKTFAYKILDDTNSKLYGESNTNSCNIIPVIVVNKSNL